MRFEEFAPQLKEGDWPSINRFLLEFFKDAEMKHVTAPKGSLILWDSRTVHWNQYPQGNKMRMVGFILYLPKDRLTDEARALRKEAFEKGITTGAIPSSSSDLIYSNSERYLEDPDYVQPKIHLTELGESVLAL